MAHVVVVGSELGLDTGDGEETAHADVEALQDREVKVDVFEDRVEAVATVNKQQLLAEVALGGGEAVVVSVEAGEVEAEVEVRVLHGVREALDVDDGLVEHKHRSERGNISSR